MNVQRVDRLDMYVCTTEASIADVLARIDRATPNLFQIVLSPDGRVLGTVTDGDIRRAMLRGITMSHPVEQCMHQQPLLGWIGDDAASRALLRRAWFLPVVDGSTGRLDHILVQPRQRQPSGNALVMAGGFGRRLGDLTREMPKPLLQVGGRPILDRVLEQLESAGISLIHLALHYRADQIRDFIAKRNSAASISFIDEIEPLGTAGALAQLHAGLTEPILVANGDVLTEVDYSAMREFHVRHGYDGTVAVSRYEVQVPFGVIRQTTDGLFAGIDEKPRINHFVAAGLYYLSPEIVALTPRGRPVDMPELLTLAFNANLRIGLFPVHEYWKDVGRPGDLAAADQDHTGK